MFPIWWWQLVEVSAICCGGAKGAGNGVGACYEMELVRVMGWGSGR